MVNEEKDYLNRIDTHPETHSKDGFDQKLHRFSTLTIVYRISYQTDNDTNKNREKEKEGPLEQIIYQAYKQRNEIEVCLTAIKIALLQMSTYMQNRYVLEGWLFAISWQ